MSSRGWPPAPATVAASSSLSDLPLLAALLAIAPAHREHQLLLRVSAVYSPQLAVTGVVVNDTPIGEVGYGAPGGGKKRALVVGSRLEQLGGTARREPAVRVLGQATPTRTSESMNASFDSTLAPRMNG
jgi:hypothetical protein